MSRGTLVREDDEKYAIFALGEAINMASLEISRCTGVTYERARADVTEYLSFMLKDWFLDHPQYGLPARKILPDS